MTLDNHDAIPKWLSTTIQLRQHLLTRKASVGINLYYFQMKLEDNKTGFIRMFDPFYEMILYGFVLKYVYLKRISVIMSSILMQRLSRTIYHTTA